MDFYQIDAFTSDVFKGNPAGICPLDSWIPETLMQDIATENNLSETAFYVKEGEKYNIRWFTPEEEIDLCGHATLASAHLIINILKTEEKKVHFYSHLSGDLIVTKEENLLTMEFPSRPGIRTPEFPLLNEALGIKPEKLYLSRDYMAVLKTEDEVVNLKPNMELLKKTEAFGIIVTAKGTKTDFVSRYFAPGSGIPEDPVTGSAHCTLIPYWSERLNKKELTSYQASQRGGKVLCKYEKETVKISGEAVLYLKGQIFI